MVPLLSKLLEFHAHTHSFRDRFGLLGGTRLGLALRRDYTLPPGTPFRAPTPTLPHPVWLRAGTSDAVVFQQILVWEELRFALPDPPRLIVDAGANIGLASVWFAHRHPGARVVALEPEPANFEMLRRNAAPYPNIEPRRQALWSRPGRLRITNPDAAAYGFQVGEEGTMPPAADDGVVESVDVPMLLREAGADRIDLLKLDVEGAELEILRDGADRWIDRVGTLAIELHDRFRPGCSEALERAIAGRGFTRERVGEYVVLRRG
jgi:FkbM family methyltransferase